MHSTLARVFAIGVIAINAATLADAQQGSQLVDAGKYEYDTHCAACHGVSGKGDGPYVQQLRSGIVVPNLTELSKGNNGVFPFARIVKTIDGRAPVKAHGPTDMPIWGQVYKIEGQNLNPNHDPEGFARVKILFLTEYIYRLQAK